MKVCNKCKESKSLEDFPVCKRNKDGYRSNCKVCMNRINKIYRDNNKESFNSARRKYYQENIEYIREQKRLNSKKFKVAKAAYDKVYRQNNKQRISLLKRIWEKNNLTIERRIKNNLRRRMNHALKGNIKSDKTFILLGCSVEYFKTHLEQQFVEGMSWDNYGEWHIDHIIPCYKFDLTIPSQQAECFHYSNQRPLWALDNLTRSRSI